MSSSSSSSDDDNDQGRRRRGNGATTTTTTTTVAANADPMGYFFASGDQYDAKDVPLDAKLLAARNQLATQLEDNARMCVHVSRIPEHSASWLIDTASPTSFTKMNGGKTNWKDALDATDMRSFEDRFPRKPHTPLTKHTITIEANFPTNREYVNIIEEAKTLVETKEAVQVAILPSGSAKTFFQSAAEDSMGKSQSQYQAKILSITAVNARNPFPFTVAVNMSTISPSTGEEKVWCNTPSLAPNSRFTKGVYRIPPLCDLIGLNDVVYMAPEIHTNADFGRWINVSGTKLARDLEALEFDNTIPGILAGKPFYRIDCAPILTKPVPIEACEEKDPGSKKVIWWVFAKHYAEILNMTAQLVGGMTAEYDQVTSRKEVMDPVTGVAVRFYNVAKVVYDLILQRYLPYTKHDNFLLGVGKGMYLNVACDKNASEARKDLEEFIKASKDKDKDKYGSGRITYVVEYEKFDPPHGVVDKEYLKKRLKAMAKAKAQHQTVTSTRPSLPLYNSNLHQLRAEENSRRVSSSSSTSSTSKSKVLLL